LRRSDAATSNAISPAISHAQAADSYVPRPSSRVRGRFAFKTSSKLPLVITRKAEAHLSACEYIQIGAALENRWKRDYAVVPA